MGLFDCAPPGSAEYENPILRMDLSDPDVIRVGEDYYLVASSFTYLPGVPLYHSRDMLHWRQIAWCVTSLPFDRYALPAHGSGVWAPAIRYHDGLFYVFLPLPDEGIFVTTAQDPAGPWSPLRCLWAGRGWIDPCPFWDEDGSAYLIHAFARSRCGIQHRLDLCRMAPDASRLLDGGRTVYNDPHRHPTLEGPKLYRRAGWYYIFAPAGGVATGWQTVLRSRSIFGPYEDRVVLAQGRTDVNGPHQGAWVDTPDGRDFFYHFQDRGVYGRVLHLQPMTWKDGWPVLGERPDPEGVGRPVKAFPLPLKNAPGGDFAPAADDGFPGPELGFPWQFQANPRPEWYQVCKGLHLAILPCVRGESLLWYLPNVLSQLAQDWRYTMEVTLSLEPKEADDEAGVALLGHRYSALALHHSGSGTELRLYRGQVTEQTPEGRAEETLTFSAPWPQDTATLRLHMDPAGVRYAWVAPDGAERPLPGVFPAEKSAWSAARPSLFARNTQNRAGGSGLFRRVRFFHET